MSPLVLKKLDPGVLKLDLETLAEILRQTLDTFHWDIMLWGLSIMQAERWFTLEAELSPRKRGRGIVAQERIVHAKALVQQGFSKSQKACKLGISPSTISKWIARGLY